MDALALVLKIAALAAVVVCFAPMLGRLQPADVTLFSRTSEKIPAVVILVGSHLLITWAWGPWIAAVVVALGFVWMVEPWDVVRTRRRRGYGSRGGDTADESLHPEMAGTTPAMTAEERAAWEDIEQRLTDDGAA